MSLSFEGVTLAYDELIALDNLNLHVASGEALAVIGPSGCGKSSMLRLAAGLAQPIAGTVAVDGKTLAGPRQETALILQDYGLLPWKTALANAELGLVIQGVSADERRQRALSALKRVDLEAFAQSYPRQLSGGMQQRLALARALALDATMLLMDEPLSALDALLREELQNTLLTCWQEKRYTQVLVTHSIEEAVFLGQRIVVMAPRPGRVVACLDNPPMGSLDYRNEEAFFAQCRAVRAALEGGARS